MIPLVTILHGAQQFTTSEEAVFFFHSVVNVIQWNGFKFPAFPQRMKDRGGPRMDETHQLQLSNAETIRHWEAVALKLEETAA